MTDVILETTGTNDLRPKETANRNLIPHVDEPDPPEGTNALGTAQNPWYGLVVRGNLLWSLIFSWYGYDRVLLGFDTVPSITYIKARTAMEQHDDESTLAVLQLGQKAPNGPLLYIDANEDNNQTATISKVNGTGALEGPKKKFGQDLYGWKFANKMKKEFLNGVEYWSPLYVPDEQV